MKPALHAVVVLIALASLASARADAGDPAPAVSIPVAAASGVVSQDTPESALARIREIVTPLLDRPQPPLFARHLRSVLALCQEGVVRLQLAGPARDAQAADLLSYLRTIEAGLRQYGSEPGPYLVDGRRSLVIARLSALDGSIQYYTVQLPPHWDPDKAYPLGVFLHGNGPALPLAYVSFAFAPDSGNSAPPPGPDVILLNPWLRGNQAFSDNGDPEIDLWEAIDDLKTWARIDEDRCYIAGHSGGADDVWAVVLRTPDRWAAAGMLAGSTYGAPVDLGLVPNASHVPFYIWIGADDQTHRLPSNKEARDALTSVGNPPMFVVEPGVAHMFRPQDLLAMGEWLFGHVRQRPNHFSFIADTPRHRGIWGISIPRKYPYDQTPTEPRVRFECWLSGNTVRVRTWDARKLTVDFGPNGLKMTGAVKLVVNGRTRYDGPAPDKPLALAW